MGISTRSWELLKDPEMQGEFWQVVQHFKQKKKKKKEGARGFFLSGSSNLVG